MSGDATRIETASVFLAHRVSPGNSGGEGGSVKPITCFWRGGGRKSAILIGVALLSFPVIPNAGFAQRSAGNVQTPPAASRARPSQVARQRPFPTPPREEPPYNAHKQQRDLMKMKFEKMKGNADELAELAKSLQQDLNESNENVLSVEVVQKAEKIEKLAKKIRSAARGF